MTNRYGEKLDRNKYMRSILQDDKQAVCFLCGKVGCCRHEVFFGSNRNKSKQLGLWVILCAECHTDGRNAVHRDWKANLELKKKGQEAAMRYYAWSEDEFRKEFGKSYTSQKKRKKETGSGFAVTNEKLMY